MMPWVRRPWGLGIQAVFTDIIVSPFPATRGAVVDQSFAVSRGDMAMNEVIVFLEAK